LLAEEPAGLEAPLEALDTGGEGMPAMAPAAPAGAAYELPQAEYTIWNLLGLLLIVLLLMLGGVLMMDVVRNIWSWNGDFSTTSSLMDAIVGLFD
jgi:membrane protein DedA with SNARE-associated domain